MSSCDDAVCCCYWCGGISYVFILFWCGVYGSMAVIVWDKASKHIGLYEILICFNLLVCFNVCWSWFYKHLLWRHMDQQIWKWPMCVIMVCKVASLIGMLEIEWLLWPDGWCAICECCVPCSFTDRPYRPTFCKMVSALHIVFVKCVPVTMAWWFLRFGGGWDGRQLPNEDLHGF